MAGFGDLYGITVSGARQRRRGLKPRPHGTTKVAVLRGQIPVVWEFAIDRGSGVRLRDAINNVLAGLGRPPLPFVEALDGFELAPAATAIADQEASWVPMENPPNRRRLTTRQRRLIFGLVGGVVVLEIVIPLLILGVI